MERGIIRKRMGEEIFLNELCKKKGHMWYSNKRILSKSESGIYSICVEKRCTRCGAIEKILRDEL